MSVDEFLKYVNSPAVHKYKDEDGDTILCVRFEDQLSLRSQPRFSHSVGRPASLKRSGYKGSHERWNDSSVMIQDGDKGNHQGSNNSSVITAFGYNISSASCPSQTLAFREVKKEDVLRMGGVSGYMKKSPPPSRADFHILVGSELGTSHEYAVVEFTFEEAVVGTSAANSVWKPHVAEDGHFSLSQVWVSEKNRVESIEAGWHVHPVRYNDDEPRFFIYWTADRYQGTGCYNTYCPGFVVLNDFVFRGKPLKATQFHQPNQYELPITIKLSEKDGKPGWYLTVVDKVVGYWPSELFASLTESSSLIVYGGEVSHESSRSGLGVADYDDEPEPGAASVSKTDMGSGRFPKGGWRSSADIRKIQFYGNNGNAVDGRSYLMASKPKCYDVTLEQKDDSGGLHVFYGGPGADAPDCRP